MDANLSRGMRQLNAVNTQTFSHLQGRIDHIFEERYKAILVQFVTIVFLELNSFQDRCRYRWGQSRLKQKQTYNHNFRIYI